uniref:Uncharacterized protein n=1 Tax=Arundo donax TaxID=35708 RepID=A0A0A9G3T6_ARUDO
MSLTFPSSFDRNESTFSSKSTKLSKLSIWFEDDASPLVPSVPQIIELFCIMLTLLATGTPPPGV